MTLWTSTCLLTSSFSLAVPMVNDPKGFQGITWGAALSDNPALALVDEGSRIREYAFKKNAPMFGKATVDAVKLLTIEGKFARVTIRYQGNENHEHLLDYLEATYGPLDRTPGQTMAGANQTFNWQGPETHINLNYQAHGERGFLFIESRRLAPKFTELIGGQ